MKGLGASPGIAIAKAYVKTAGIKIEKTMAENTDTELTKLFQAIEKSKEQLDEIRKITETKIGADEALIFEAHALILEDPDLVDKTIEKIKKDGVSAAWAVKETADELAQLFKDIEDDYIKERVLDLQDVSLRLIENILGLKGFDYSSIIEPVVIVADELTPSDMSRISTDRVLGIITETGGTTSHTAIMSRVMGLPAIVGAEGLLKAAKDGDILIMNGGSGEFYINPEAVLLERFENERNLLHEQQQALQSYIGAKTLTADGIEISVGCNIGAPKDLEAVLKNDGEGIGLFRSEFLYMDRSAMPTEEEQFVAYKAAAEAMAGKPVIIRTLDIGGDKQLTYMDFPKEDNPFLGYRAIRYCLEERELFRIQLRAILRASAFGNIKIMLPMISGVDEVRKARLELQKSMGELEDRELDYDKSIELGIMIETPSAAIISDKLAEEVDFFSIGTNDLTQYTLAVDRMNSKISHLYTPYHPAVLRLIKLVADNAKRAGIWIGMCGEAAQDELLVPVFVGMGLNELSVSPPQVLKIRKLINSLNKKDMEHHIESIMNLPNAESVFEYLKT
ncbi:MAG TPA: phosphoenolpyruvate--protein phosphotransferase [Patescibacteria group bacterium]|nr:phosphoenolpyruvate--protein phosphotransferase [Patescibacteria group bacterium]